MSGKRKAEDEPFDCSSSSDENDDSNIFDNDDDGEYEDKDGDGFVSDEEEEGEDSHDDEEEDSTTLKDNAENGNSEGSYIDDDECDSLSSVSIDCSETQRFVLEWLEERRESGVMPLHLLETLGICLEVTLPSSTEEAWGFVAKLLTTPHVAETLCHALSNHRSKLPHINTFDDAIELIRTSSRIVVLTGAGVSVSCGIPDFRSPGGLYEQIEEKYNLPDPQCLFDIHYLREDPAPFFEFAREIYPGKHRPSVTHLFIKELEDRGKLLRNYTQNIDTLEMAAGIHPDKLVNCHGSFATASCMVCKAKVEADAIREEIMNRVIPKCKPCNCEEAFMKPDIVFFGEQLPDRFGECFKEDGVNVDLLIVMGSSLQVRPVAFIPELMNKEIPQLLVNRELVAEPHEFDYVYLGDCDNFVIEVCKKLGWTVNKKAPEDYIIAKTPTIPASDIKTSTNNVKVEGIGDSVELPSVNKTGDYL